MATLFVVATPIGNMTDLSGRARDVLVKAPVIVSEDPRASEKLLKPIGATGTLISYFGKDKRPNIARVLQSLTAGEDVALISEAGTPGINDPGGELVAAARTAGHTIVPIPGAHAGMTVASASGFPMEEFVFKGFVPHKKGRETFFKTVATLEPAVIMYESPHRIRKTFEALANVAPTRLLCVGRELTKLHEQIVVARAQEIAAMTEEQLPSRGEFALVLAPRDFSPQHKPAQ